MKVIFRTDSSVRIGTGHCMRCLTLADELRMKGAQIEFISRELPGNIIHLVEHRGYRVHRLPLLAGESVVAEGARSDFDWLSVKPATDAQQTIQALEHDGTQSDWLIVDQYGIDREWETKLRAHSKRLMVIDDLADRKHDCDILVDQNLVDSLETRYSRLVSENCKTLLGPTYSILRPDFGTIRSEARQRQREVKRLLVCFGGSDWHNETTKALLAIRALEKRSFEVDVVLGPSNPHKDSIERACREIEGTSCYFGIDDIVPIMSEADLAVGAGGISVWERCCLGLPSIVVSVAENQIPSCEASEKEGIIKYLGRSQFVTEKDLTIAIDQLVTNSEARLSMSLAAEKAVDGAGVGRVLSYLCGEFPGLSVRKATAFDMTLLFDWANDPVVRMNSFNRNPIEFSDHMKWFRSKLENKNTYIYILESDGTPVGQIRFDVEGSIAEIDYSIDARHRGRGYSTKILSLGLKELKVDLGRKITLQGQVKRDNARSIAAFQKMGFAEEGSNEEMMVFRHSG